MFSKIICKIKFFLDDYVRNLAKSPKTCVQTLILFAFLIWLTSRMLQFQNVHQLLQPIHQIGLQNSTYISDGQSQTENTSTAPLVQTKNTSTAPLVNSTAYISIENSPTAPLVQTENSPTAPLVNSTAYISIENSPTASSSSSSLVNAKNETSSKGLEEQQSTALPNLLMNGNFVAIQYNESKLAHRLLDGKRGIEIGGSMHNPFGLDAMNVDYTDDPSALFQKEQVKVSGSSYKVDIIAPGDKLPFSNNSVDFVINSHVLEHFYDPIQTIEEWLRVVKPGGFVYMDIPHKERSFFLTFDRGKIRTTLAELLERHSKPKVTDTNHAHQSVWITEDLLELCRHFNWTVVEWRDTDDKLGIGFTIVLKKT